MSYYTRLTQSQKIQLLRLYKYTYINLKYDLRHLEFFFHKLDIGKPGVVWAYFRFKKYLEKEFRELFKKIPEEYLWDLIIIKPNYQVGRPKWKKNCKFKKHT